MFRCEALVHNVELVRQCRPVAPVTLDEGVPPLLLLRIGDAVQINNRDIGP